MDTVFSHIIQKRFSQSNEDVATDALAFILYSSDRALAGFLKLLRGVEPALPDLQFRTQQTEGSIRPDMWGFHGADHRVFVENKFWAGLTDNQPVAYLKQLSRCEQPTVLLIVVPAAREQMIWRELSARLDDAEIERSDRVNPAGITYNAKTSLGPVLALASWPRVLYALELEAAEDARVAADIAQLRSLTEAADNEAFIPVRAEQRTDQRIPAFILQLNTIVEDSVQLALNEGVLNIMKLRPQASWNRIGRYIRFNDQSACGAWIGVQFDHWKNVGDTPLWLVLKRGEFGRAEEAQPLLEGWASKRGCITVSDNDSISLGLELLAGEDKDVVVRSIVDTLRGVSSALCVLPPNSSDGEPTDE